MEIKGKLKLVYTHDKGGNVLYSTFCITCSAAIGKDDNFCRNCGTDFEEKVFTSIKLLLNEVRK